MGDLVPRADRRRRGGGHLDRRLPARRRRRRGDGRAHLAARRQRRRQRRRRADRGRARGRARRQRDHGGRGSRRAASRVFRRAAGCAPRISALLATFGAVTVEVFRRPRIAVLSTGNELCAPEATPRPGQVRDANQCVLGAQSRGRRLRRDPRRHRPRRRGGAARGGAPAARRARCRDPLGRLVGRDQGCLRRGAGRSAAARRPVSRHRHPPRQADAVRARGRQAGDRHARVSHLVAGGVRRLHPPAALAAWAARRRASPGRRAAPRASAPRTVGARTRRLPARRARRARRRPVGRAAARRLGDALQRGARRRPRLRPRRRRAPRRRGRRSRCSSTSRTDA